jgi:hypothetical protein
MRALVVRPGPAYSVQDVHRGLVTGLKANGVEVHDFFYDDLLEFHSAAHIKVGKKWKAGLDKRGALQACGEWLQAAIYRVWPDLLIFTSGFWIHPEVLGVLKFRPHHTVLWCTESPYEDDRQAETAEWVDTCIINDPTHLGMFRQVNPNTHYLPQSYDPTLHFPGPGRPEWACDVAFAGTCFPSRQAFLEEVDWTGLDLKLAGMFANVPDDWPLLDRLIFDRNECIDNAETVDLYRSCRASFNLYRREANHAGLSFGWAMGPREVELAATGTFFLRDPRPEGDEVLGMLPTFDSPGDFSEKVRWWLAHDDLRDKVTGLAREAVADRTFQATTARLLALVDRAPKAA